MTVNCVASLTATVLGVVTIASAMMAASVVTTVATIAYSILAITFSAFSIAAITAWISTKDPNDVAEYFENMKNHLKISLAGVYQFVAQALVQSVVSGIAKGIEATIRRKISGPDVVFAKERRG